MQNRNHFAALLTDGTQVLIRPLTHDDKALEKDFILRLSPESRRFRFLATIGSPSDQLLDKLTDLKAGTEAAFVAVIPGKSSLEIGVARVCVVGAGRAEFAVAVSDEWQRRGLGTLLAQCAFEAARKMGVHTLFSIEAAANLGMREWATSIGFERASNPVDATEVIQTMTLANFDKRHRQVPHSQASIQHA